MGKKVLDFCDVCKREFTQSPLIQSLYKGVISKYKRYYFRSPQEGMWDKVIDIEVCRDCAKEIDEYLTKKAVWEGGIMIDL